MSILKLVWYHIKDYSDLGGERFKNVRKESSTDDDLWGCGGNHPLQQRDSAAITLAQHDALQLYGWPSGHANGQRHVLMASCLNSHGSNTWRALMPGS